MTAFGELWAPPKPAERPINKQVSDAIAAKTELAGTAAPVTGQVATTIADFHKQEPVKATADVLKLSGTALAKAGDATATAAKLGAGGQLLTTADALAKGDTYTAAAAAQRMASAAQQSQQMSTNTGNSEPKKVEQIRNIGAKVGRNDPCPCGSGKKYKNCHMKVEAGR